MPTAEKVRQADLLPSDEVAPRPDSFATVVERLAANPAVDVAKLEKLIEMQERILRFNAESAFNAAYARMQPQLPEIDEKGQIWVKGSLRSTYAKYEDIKKVITPILKEFGFAVRHRTEWPADKPGVIRIVGVLTHEQGHKEESAFEAEADKSDFRTDIQSQGSTVSYGRRYTTIDLLNITTRGQDNDGQRRQKPDVPAPDGFDAWIAVLESVASEGLAALTKAWNDSKVEYRNHLMAVDKSAWPRMKATAQQVTAK